MISYYIKKIKDGEMLWFNVPPKWKNKVAEELVNKGYALNDDGTVTSPTEIKNEESLSLEDVKRNKIEEMNHIQQETINTGVEVELSDGTVERFELTTNDQMSLMGLQSQVATGVEYIPWHTSDNTEHCKYYSNADMGKIIMAALSYVTYHVTYFRDLRIYINSMTDKEQVKAVTYGVEIPIEYRSQVLNDMIQPVLPNPDEGNNTDESNPDEVNDEDQSNSEEAGIAEEPTDEETNDVEESGSEETVATEESSTE